MKRAPWYVLAGTVAGFLGVLGLHRGPATHAALPQAKTGPRANGSASPAASSGGSGAPAGPAHSATGRLENYGYGELAVRVIARGSDIVAVTVPTLRTAEPYSQQIAQQVLPMLRSEVLAAHSAQISAVSGATYTCEAYAASLQSALDKLHVR